MVKYRNTIDQRLSGRHLACAESIDYTNKKIINIGCGIGIFEYLVGEQSKEMVGIDSNPIDILTAELELKSSKINFVKADIIKHELPNESCDVVTMFDVIEHLPENHERLIAAKVYHSLRPGGRFVISTPLDNFTKYFDPAWYMPKSTGKNHRHYTVESLIEPLVEEGFEIESINVRGRLFELLSMFLFYPFKWIFNMEVPFKRWLDKHREKEYKKGKGFNTNQFGFGTKLNGFVTLFVVARKK